VESKNRSKKRREIKVSFFSAHKKEQKSKQSDGSGKATQSSVLTRPDRSIRTFILTRPDRCIKNVIGILFLL
jgi:hypothetical protein